MRNVKTKLTKRRIALMQLERSLCVLEDGDPVSAVTLAGAAEEIFGQIARRRGLPPCVEFSAEGIRGLLTRSGAAPPSKKRLIAILNFSKNHAKHQDDGRNLRIDIDWQFEAEYMIFRAMLNHYNAFECWPASKRLQIWMGNLCPSLVA
jgi:hypothetical protein